MSLENYGGALSSDDIVDNPHKFGWVTFNEFKKNPEKWIGRKDDVLASADKGSHTLKSIRKHIYEVEGYRCKGLEEVQKTAECMGIDLNDLEMKPDMIQAGAGKFDVIVRFVSKQTKERRESWR